VCSFAIVAPFQVSVPGASSEPGDGTETLVHANGETADLGRYTELAGTGAERQFGAIKSVPSDVHAPHLVSSRRGELTSSAGMPELLLRRSGTGSVLGFGLDNLVEKGHGGPTGERQGKLTFQETEELSASTSLTRHERVSPVHGS
jgi:hypothetical protein